MKIKPYVILYTQEEADDLVGNLKSTVQNINKKYISSDEFLDGIDEFERYIPMRFESYGNFE